jgi:RES domain-containing protein
MRVWRLCRAAFADLGGDGARLYGGRWNSPGRPMVYAASSAALCVLEVRVHLDLPPDLISDDYVLTTISLDGLSVESVETLPDNARSFGDAWLQDQRTAVLRVPSLIVPESHNLLLNPTHPQANAARLLDRRPFAFDRGLWLPL